MSSDTMTESRRTGRSPTNELEPYYTNAVHLYEVHGSHGEDPTEPYASAQYPFPAVSHEPRIQQLSDDLEAAGYHPFHAPCGIRLIESNMPQRDAPDKSARGQVGNQCIRDRSHRGRGRTRRRKQAHAIDFWLSTEDLPRPDNRVTVDDEGRLTIRYKATNDKPKEQLYGQLKSMLHKLHMEPDHLFHRFAYKKNEIPVAGVAHQAGTCRMGGDAKSSAMANSLRVGDHLLERLDARVPAGALAG